MFGAKYGRAKFWVTSLSTMLITWIPFLSLARLFRSEDLKLIIMLAMQVVLMNILANRIRDYGSSPWLALWSLLPFVGLIQALYFGIRYKKLAEQKIKNARAQAEREIEEYDRVQAEREKEKQKTKSDISFSKPSFWVGWIIILGFIIFLYNGTPKNDISRDNYVTSTPLNNSESKPNSYVPQDPTEYYHLLETKKIEQENNQVEEVINQYSSIVRQRVKRYWNKPNSVEEGLKCTLQISLMPDGDVKSVSFVNRSGNQIFDRSAESAVYKAAPFPLPLDPAARAEFRNFTLVF